MRNWFKNLFGIFVVLTTLLFVTSNVYAAVGMGEATPDVASSTDGTSYSTAAFGPSNNAILVVWVAASGTADPGSLSTSTGGLTWNKVADVVYNSVNTLYVFWAYTGASAPGSVVVTFTCAGDAATGAIIAVDEVTGADLVTPNPIKQFKTNAAGTSNPTVVMDAAMTAGNGDLAAFGRPANPPGALPPGGGAWSEIADNGYTTPSNGMSAAHTVGDTSNTITFTDDAGSYGIIGIEIYASGTGPVPGAIIPGGTQLLMGAG